MEAIVRITGGKRMDYKITDCDIDQIRSSLEKVMDKTNTMQKNSMYDSKLASDLEEIREYILWIAKYLPIAQKEEEA